MKFFELFRKQETRSAIGAGGWPVSLPGSAQAFASSPHFAENLSAVFACVSAISSAISALPALLYQKHGKRRSEVEFGAMRDLFHNPNPWQSMPEFIEMLVAQILLRGNGLVEIVSDRAGNVVMLRCIPWNWCNCYMLPSGRLVYDVYDQPGIWAPAQGKRRRLLQSDVIHIRDRSDDGLIGKSRLQRAAATLSLVQTVNEHAQSQYANGVSPGGILSMTATLRPDQLEDVRNAFQKSHSGTRNIGRVIVVPCDSDFKAMPRISPEDQELLESRKFGTEEIARLFGVPPPIIQDYSNNTFTNSEQAGRWFAQFCLLPLVRKLEAAFNWALFPDGGHEIVLDMSAYDRGDPTTRWQAHAIAVKNRILDADEIREIEGWGPKARESDSTDSLA